MNWDSAAERELWADICYKDFYWFVRVAYGLDQQAAVWAREKPHAGPYWFTPRIHKPICEWYQQHAEEWLRTRRGTYLCLLIPRFFGKTTLITQAGQLWLHLRDPDLSTYTGSETTGRASEFMASMLAVVDGTDPTAWFTYFYGNWYSKDRKWRADMATHAARRQVGRKEPSFGVWGVERGITGMHPDGGFFDDPTSYEAMALHAEWFRVVNDHLASLVPVFTDTCFFVMPGTRYGDGDHFGSALRRDGIASLAGMPMPDLSPRVDGKWHVYFLKAREYDTRTPIFPERCGEKFLTDYERQHNLRYYAQMENDPAGSEYNPLTREDVRKMWVTQKDLPRSLRITIHLDTAFKSTERQARGDESVIIVMGHARNGEGDVYYLEGYGSNTWRMEDYLDKLVQILQRQRSLGRRVFAITDEVEPGGKAGTWEYAIRTRCHTKNVTMPAFIPLTRGGKKKIARIVEAASYWREDYMHLLENAPGVERLVDQMVRIGNSAHDDWADAAADTFHGSIYRPPGKPGPKTDNDVVTFPGDEELKGRIPTSRALRLYDEAHENNEYLRYDPV